MAVVDEVIRVGSALGLRERIMAIDIHHVRIRTNLFEDLRVTSLVKWVNDVVCVILADLGTYANTIRIVRIIDRAAVLDLHLRKSAA